MAFPGIKTEEVAGDLVSTSVAWPAVTTSPLLDCKAGRLHHLVLTGGFTSVDLMFDVTDDGDNWYPLFTADGEYKIPAAAVNDSRSIALDLQVFWGYRGVRLRLASAQSGARVITWTTYPR